MHWNSKPLYFSLNSKKGEMNLFEFWIEKSLFHSWITSPCSFCAARDMCPPVTVSMPRKPRSRSWHSTITIVSTGSLLVTDWTLLKGHMLLCLFICLCDEQGNPRSRTFTPLYLKVLILNTHTHSLISRFIIQKISLSFSSFPLFFFQWLQRSNSPLKLHLLPHLKAREKRKLISQEILLFLTLIVKSRREWQNSPRGK